MKDAKRLRRNIWSLLGLPLFFTTAGLALAQNDDDKVISESVELEEIVVYAQKVRQSWDEVALSVDAISGDRLGDSQVDSFDGLSNISSSITFVPSDDRSPSVFIRGVGTLGFQSGVEPTVLTVIDGVPLGRAGAALLDLSNVKSVEVLRGPQSTLFGKNASGGVINILTSDPTEELSGSVILNAYEDGEYGLKASLDSSLTDSIMGQLTASYKTFDGIGENTVLGKGNRTFESKGVRGKLIWDLENSVVRLNADWLERETDNNVWSIVDSTSPVYLEDLAEVGVDVGAENIDSGTGSKSDNYSKNAGVSINADYFLNDLTLTSVTAFRLWEVEHFRDVDGLPFTAPIFGHGMPSLAPLGLSTLFNLNHGITETSQFSQEIRITNSDANRFNYLAGLFYWRQDLDRFFERRLDTCLAPASFDTSGSNPGCGLALESAPFAGYEASYGFFNSEVETENVAAFGQVTWHMDELTKLTGGLRVTRDELTYTFNRPTPRLLFPSVDPYIGADSGDNTGVSGKVSVQRTLGVDGFANVYASYARGYKSPGWDILFDTSQAVAEAQPVSEETSDSYEVGFKSLLPHGGYFGITAFLVNYSGFQGQAFDPLTTSFRLSSAGEVQTKGLELDMLLKLSDELSISGSASYTDAEFVSYSNAPCFQGQTVAQGCVNNVQDLAGAGLPNAPKYKVNLLGKYESDISNSLSGFATLALNWQSDTQFSLSNDPRTLYDGYAILNLSLGLRDKSDRWEASLFINNLTDEFHVDYLFPNPVDPNGLSQFASRDYTRYIGGSLKLRY